MGDCVGILGPRQDQEDQDPHRSPHLVTLTSRHILSPLDTVRAVACPKDPRPATGAWRPPDPQGTAPGPRGGTRVRTHGEAHPGPTPHGKAQSATPTSRRMRFSVTSRRPGGVEQPPARLRGTMENGSTGQMRSGNPPPGCGGVAPETRTPRPEAWPHKKTQSGQRASLMAHPGSDRDAIKLPVVG